MKYRIATLPILEELRRYMIDLTVLSSAFFPLMNFGEPGQKNNHGIIESDKAYENPEILVPIGEIVAILGILILIEILTHRT